MDPVSRRSFIVKGSAGAAGLAAVSAGLGGAAATAAPAKPEPEPTAEELAALAGPVVVQIRDAEKGEVEILVNDQEIVFVDRALVARVLRAVR